MVASSMTPTELNVHDINMKSIFQKFEENSVHYIRQV
jgi:hypothetical protein